VFHTLADNKFKLNVKIIVFLKNNFIFAVIKIFFYKKQTMPNDSKTYMNIMVIACTVTVKMRNRASLRQVVNIYPPPPHYPNNKQVTTFLSLPAMPAYAGSNSMLHQSEHLY
jgi:hypothetical protein